VVEGVEESKAMEVPAGVARAQDLSAAPTPCTSSPTAPQGTEGLPTQTAATGLSSI